MTSKIKYLKQSIKDLDNLLLENWGSKINEEYKSLKIDLEYKLSILNKGLSC